LPAISVVPPVLNQPFIVTAYPEMDRYRKKKKTGGKNGAEFHSVCPITVTTGTVYFDITAIARDTTVFSTASSGVNFLSPVMQKGLQPMTLSLLASPVYVSTLPIIAFVHYSIRI